MTTIRQANQTTPQTPSVRSKGVAVGFAFDQGKDGGGGFAHITGKGLRALAGELDTGRIPIGKRYLRNLKKRESL